MKNLEILGVQELNSIEKSEANGGGLITIPITAFILGYLYETYVAA